MFRLEGEEGGGQTLEDAGRDERDYVRGRLREELGREPTEEEIDEWLREHTEGY
ncbi:MAG TPA: hypothetical protein VD968_00285 [Pyrinomonadaceae bacterium]|nr:hypothetical protein [Pyrinomonadaceae bacterium]